MKLNKVLHAITRKLASRYPTHHIYDEEVPENLNPPAFFVKLLNPSQEQELGNRYMRYHSFDIHYFDPNYSNISMQNVADELFDILEWLEVDGHPIRGTSMNTEIVERVLHFFVDYNFTIKRYEEPRPKMNDLDLKEDIKDG